MTDISAQLQTLLKRLESLEAEVRGLKSFDYLPKTAIVGKNYVSRLYGCTESAIVNGRCGTGELRNKRVRFKPDGWQKETVDAAYKEFIKTASERAIEAKQSANNRKRK